MNTREVIKKLKLVAGSIALLTAVGIAFEISKGLKNRRQYKRDFDPDTVEEVEGRIAEVSTDSDKHDKSRGQVLILETVNGKVIPVHLGPEWFLSHQKTRYKEGDKIIVIGSRINYQNNDVIIATKIKYGNSKLILRDESGFPRWQGWVN